MSTLLILDETSVASHERVAFGLNQAVKHAENPVLLPGESHQWDSLQVSWPATVLYSAADRKFRCWYSGLDAIQSPGRRWLNGYAESDDGVHWVKPALGQATFLDAPTNQLNPGWENYILSLVFENPLPDAPESQRFGSYWTEGSPGNGWAKSLAWSPDGIAWTRHGVVYATANRPDFHDISQLLYDADEPNPSMRIKGYTQIHIDAPHPMGGKRWPGVRYIGLVHGESFKQVDGAPDSIVLAPEPGIDEELHFATVQKVGATYLMLFESDRFSHRPIHGDLRLAYSLDGRSFRRIHRHQALLPTGAKGTWEENLLVTTTTGMQEVGDQVYIYYIGCPNLYSAWPAQYAITPERRGSQFAPTYLGLATLPRDRYAYACGGGTLTTHPISVDGKVWLNAEGSDISVIAQDAAGKTVATGGLSAKLEDGVYRAVAWQGAVPQGDVQFVVELKGGRLYSIRH